ncbi:MAG TPA: hypothetical protein VMD30_06730 [Tepidisphaeraceae bacterium]|nr:hypothetical protein [Tepidisphaeraceae bacterium]
MTDQRLGRTSVPAASSFLEGAILFTLISHIAAMGSMPLLLPGMPSGAGPNLAARAAYVAAHAWRWRTGWLAWQITAISNLLLAVALVCTSWIPRLPAFLALAATISAIIPDQTGQMLWTWRGTTLAKEAIATGGFLAYGRFEVRTFRWIAGWAGAAYTIAALCWTWCFASAKGIWTKELTRISIAAWSVFGICTIVFLLDNPEHPAKAVLTILAVGNAIAFALLVIWLAMVGEAVLRRSRIDRDHGRYAPWRHPSRGSIASVCNVVANSRLSRSLAELLPALPMDSDIRNVVYVNYLVDAERLERFVAEPLKLQRLGPEGRYGLFTFLTFRHGHFGPRLFGPFRRLWPSPIQTNWRIHVYHPRTGMRGIQFLTIGITNTLHAMAARLLAEEVPMHVLAAASVTRDASGAVHIELDPGRGTAPDAKGIFRPTVTPELPPPWHVCFGNWRGLLEYCVPQDRAMSAQPWRQRVTRQEIILNIPLANCLPMTGTVTSIAATKIAADAAPLCFFVDRISFRLLNECHDRA